MTYRHTHATFWWATAKARYYYAYHFLRLLASTTLIAFTPIDFILIVQYYEAVMTTATLKWDKCIDFDNAEAMARHLHQEILTWYVY